MHVKQRRDNDNEGGLTSGSTPLGLFGEGGVKRHRSNADETDSTVGALTEGQSLRDPLTGQQRCGAADDADDSDKRTAKGNHLLRLPLRGHVWFNVS